MTFTFHRGHRRGCLTCNVHARSMRHDGMHNMCAPGVHNGCESRIDLREGA